MRRVRAVPPVYHVAVIVGTSKQGADTVSIFTNMRARLLEFVNGLKKPLGQFVAEERSTQSVMLGGKPRQIH
eukprot:6204788-Pleurochrysis_carterae.AAC.1